MGWSKEVHAVRRSLPRDASRARSKLAPGHPGPNAGAVPLALGAAVAMSLILGAARRPGPGSARAPRRLGAPARGGGGGHDLLAAAAAAPQRFVDFLGRALTAGGRRVGTRAPAAAAEGWRQARPAAMAATAAAARAAGPSAPAQQPKHHPGGGGGGGGKKKKKNKKR